MTAVDPRTDIRGGPGHPPPADGDLTGRGNPVLRGAITGGGTFADGIFHTLPRWICLT